jgi:hypothetical protein
VIARVKLIQRPRPLLPKRFRGRQSPKAQARYNEHLAAFCALIRKIHCSMDFKVGSRGWCYILERHGLRKGDFGDAESLISACRKSGDLPLDICAEDGSRETIGVEQLNTNDIPTEVEAWVNHLRNHAHETYTPISFWDDLDVYVEVGVEKHDLRNLFEPVCAEFHVPITNFKGWSDINSRAAMMRRFRTHEMRGKRCVLLLCTDHDPGGLHQAEKLRKNMEDLSRAVGWSPDNLVIIRFGLNADFIDAHGLTWIDNLETSSGGQLDDPEHNDHDKPYVQDYIAKFGARKCEANALVVEPEVGRELCRSAILEEAVMDWFEKLTGFPEGSYEDTRAKLSVDGSRLRSLVNGKSYHIGTLQLLSLEELRHRGKAEDEPSGQLKLKVVTGDVGQMHHSIENAGALFQVASQFNLLEMVSPTVTPEHGVTRYHCDRTQGPACAIAAGAATIYRNYFALVDGDQGQTAERQLDGLASVGEALSKAIGKPVSDLWSMQNGYALCSRNGLDAIARHLADLSPAELEVLRGRL